MPANLTQQHRNAEKQYRQAATADEQLRCLQLMLQEIPKHKGTDKLQADRKRKISRAKQEVVEARAGKKGYRDIVEFHV